MNPKLLLLLISFAAFSSCNTIYKTGQTPDDVYYSPARSYGEADENRDSTRDEGVDKYQRYNDDRAIRMGINDARWRYLDNDYGYNQYYSPYNQYYSNYNFGFNHGYYYNPYFWPYPVYSPVFIAPSSPKIATPRVNNLGAYGSVRGYNNAPLSPKSSRTAPVRNYNNNNGSAVGNALRRVLSQDNSNGSYNNNNNNRTYTPSNNNNNNTRSYTPSNSSSSSGSSSSGSSGGGGISRPARSGGR